MPCSTAVTENIGDVEDCGCELNEALTAAFLGVGQVRSC